MSFASHLGQLSRNNVRDSIQGDRALSCELAGCGLVWYYTIPVPVVRILSTQTVLLYPHFHLKWVLGIVDSLTHSIN
eukprot:scaffold14226_cov186-Amphora_coffeaeformis.AAC.5